MVHIGAITANSKIMDHVMCGGKIWTLVTNKEVDHEHYVPPRGWDTASLHSGP